MSLDTLPYDVFFSIIPHLELQDAMNLGRTCRQLKAILQDRWLCRKLIYEQARFSLEGALADEGLMSYSDAVDRLYLRRRGFAAAAPRSVSILGSGSHLIYRQGVLCFIKGSELTVLTISGRTDFSRTLNLASFVPALSSNEQPSFFLLNYSDGVVAVRFFPQADSISSQLVAIDVDTGAVLGTVLLQQCGEVFVRHTARYFYYGTHSGRGDHGYDEWVIEGLSLDKDFSFAVKPRIQLRDFVGSDIGSTVAFEIHDGHFYALSNQTSFDVEEVDWTSFYHCVRFPLDDPSPKMVRVNKYIYRRQHEEGPVNDSWTDLGFQVDERTNELLIIEARREWQPGSSSQARKFYIQPIPFPERDEDGDNVDDGAFERQLHPTDVMAQLAGSSSKALYAPSEKRHPKNIHLEYGFENDPAASFILFRTKFRCYNLSCSAFLDVVEDASCCQISSRQPCLRLRVGSRLPSPLITLPEDPQGELVSKNHSRCPPKHASVQPFRYEAIRMWPPPAATSTAAADMHRILSAPELAGRSGKSVPLTTTCAADERSLVILRKIARPKSKEEENGQIILVNFDSYVSPKGGDSRLLDKRICAKM